MNIRGKKPTTLSKESYGGWAGTATEKREGRLHVLTESKAQQRKCLLLAAGRGHQPVES